MPANSSSGFRTSGTKDSPGGGYKRNFNMNPRGKFPLRMKTTPKRSSSRSSSRA